MLLAVDNYLTFMGIVSIILAMLIVAYFQLKSAPLILDRIWAGTRPEDLLNIFNNIKKILLTAKKLALDPFTIYYIAYGTTATFGVTHSHFWFAF